MLYDNMSPTTPMSLVLVALISKQLFLSEALSSSTKVGGLVFNPPSITENLGPLLFILSLFKRIPLVFYIIIIA